MAKRALVTRRELADRLSVHMQTITKWEREGMPIAEPGGKGRASKYDAAVVAKWKADRDKAAGATPTFQLSRQRKELAQALEAEQRIAIKAGKLVDAKEVEQVMADEYARCRTKLLGLPRKAKAVLPHLTTRDVQALDVLVREALEDLAEA